MVEVLIGFIGVIIGAFITPMIEWARSLHASKKNAYYVSIRVICILENFINNCVAIANDNGFHNKYGGITYNSKTPESEIFPKDIDWSDINQEILYRILILPSKINEAHNYIEFIWKEIVSDIDDDLSLHRQYEFSVLGLYATELADDLRKKYKLPPRDRSEKNPDWNEISFFGNKIESLKKIIL